VTLDTPCAVAVLCKTGEIKCEQMWLNGSGRNPHDAWQLEERFVNAGNCGTVH